MPVAPPTGDGSSGASQGGNPYGTAYGQPQAAGGQDASMANAAYGQKSGGDDYGRERNSAGYHPYKR